MIGYPRIQLKVRRAQVSYLYANGSYSMPALFLITLLAIWTSGPYVLSPLWHAWLVSSVIILAGRTTHLWWRRTRRSTSIRRLEYEYFIGSTCSAIVWCMGLIFFMSRLPDVERMLMLLLSCMYISASGVLLLNSARCFYATVVPIAAVILLELSTELSPSRNLLMAVVLFCLLFAALARRHVLHWQLADLADRYAHAAMARKLKRTTETLRVASQQDGLTELANRGWFDEQLSTYWRRCSRAVSPLALLLIDVDHFKQFNDKYGHQAGDECLRQMGWLIQGALRREEDLAARYGGEEFVVLLPYTGLEGARQMAVRIQQALQQKQIPHLASSVASIVTCSIGVAAITPDMHNDSAELVERADVALYRAKRQGRNRIVIAD